MKAQLRAYLDSIDENLEAVYGDKPKIIYGRVGEGLWLDCGVILPQSAEGRSVQVFIPPNLIAPLMKACREQMIKERSQTLAEAEKVDETRSGV